MTATTETLPVATRTAPRKVRREQLIKATIQSIAKRGLAETTLAHVTLGANLSLGTANYHFTSKQTLFVETLKYLVEEHRNQWRKNLERSSIVAQGPTPGAHRRRFPSGDL